MEERQSIRKITCNVCGEENVRSHKFDKKACCKCGDEYFLSIRPPLTIWTKGLTAFQKSRLIKELMKSHYEKEKLYKMSERSSRASCKASYLEHQAAILKAA